MVLIQIGKRSLIMSTQLKFRLSRILIAVTIISTCSILQSQDRPNVIIMMSDDQVYGDIGAHGNPSLETPNLESIGEHGVEMTHFFAYPNCSSSRAAV